jgi:N-acetylmuramoyl-L-alanine amidase
VLDPGHNGRNGSATGYLVDAGNGVHKPCNTTGTSTDAGYAEHAFTWDVALRAKPILEAAGATVVLTRDSDTGLGPCVNERAHIGNEARANAVVGIHADGHLGGGHGFFVMQPPADNPNVNPGGANASRRLARVMHMTFAKSTGIPSSTYISGGFLTTSDTGGITLSNRPVITIECLNMRDAGDAAKATDPQWRQRIAEGIAAGITAFLTAG